MLEHICKNERAISDNEASIKLLSEKHEKMFNRMFVDNGKASFQTVQDRQQRLLNVIVWLVTVTVSSVIGMVIRTIFIALQS